MADRNYAKEQLEAMRKSVEEQKKLPAYESASVLTMQSAWEKDNFAQKELAAIVGAYNAVMLSDDLKAIKDCKEGVEASKKLCIAALCNAKIPSPGKAWLKLSAEDLMRASGDPAKADQERKAAEIKAAEERAQQLQRELDELSMVDDHKKKLDELHAKQAELEEQIRKRKMTQGDVCANCKLLLQPSWKACPGCGREVQGPAKRRKEDEKMDDSKDAKKGDSDGDSSVRRASFAPSDDSKRAAVVKSREVADLLLWDKSDKKQKEIRTIDVDPDDGSMKMKTTKQPRTIGSVFHCVKLLLAYGQDYAVADPTQGLAMLQYVNWWLAESLGFTLDVALQMDYDMRKAIAEKARGDFRQFPSLESAITRTFARASAASSKPQQRGSNDNGGNSNSSNYSHNAAPKVSRRTNDDYFCDRFNDGRVCPHEATEGGCNFTHGCRYCGKADHGAVNCSKKQPGTPSRGGNGGGRGGGGRGGGRGGGGRGKSSSA